MTSEELEEAKRQVHKLLKEYESNKGMAAMVCGTAVTFLPQSEQDRLFKGFFTPGNLAVFRGSEQNLVRARDIELDAEDRSKVEAAIVTVGKLIEEISNFSGRDEDRDKLKAGINAVLNHPLPEDSESLADALSHQVEALIFLSAEPIESKDDWDRMVDCVQLHDALSRSLQASKKLESLSPNPESSFAKHSAIAAESKHGIEAFLAGKLEITALTELTKKLLSELESIWKEG